MNNFLETWGRELRGRLRILSYDDAYLPSSLKRGTYIFSDLERLSAFHLQLAGEIAGRLSEAGVRILNQPRRVLRRYELLRALHERGINNFTAYRLADLTSAGGWPATLKFPVFIRGEHDHNGNISPLLLTATQLETAVREIQKEGRSLRDLLLVEFCDTSDASGLYRKYSAFMIGDRFVPRHIQFGKKWVLKKPDLIDEQKVREELDYLQQSPHPHEQQVREIFRLGGIQYGRIDYSLFNGAIQVWEINTNPTLTVHPEKVAPQRLPAHAFIAREICSALSGLDAEKASGLIRLRFSADLQRVGAIRCLPEWALRARGRALKFRKAAAKMVGRG